MGVRARRPPVVHLNVDVCRVVRASSGADVGVPDALECGGLCAGARGGDEEVVPEIKVALCLGGGVVVAGVEVEVNGGGVTLVVAVVAVAMSASRSVLGCWRRQ